MRKSTAAPTLDRNNPVPLYEQIKLRLLGELRDGDPEAELLLSDTALMQRFGVSRMTARNALADLVRQGLVKRVPGRGTFLVREPRLSVRLDGLDRFFQEWHLAELDPGTQVLHFRHVSADADVAAKLHVLKGSSVLVLRRLRTAHGEPATLDVRYVAGWCARNITRQDAEREMLFDIVAAKGGVPTTAVEQEVGATRADAVTAKILRVPAGSPLLSRQVTFFTTGDRPIITGCGLYRSDRFRFHMRAER